MGIIKNLTIKIESLEKENQTLKEKLRTIETNLASVIAKLTSPSIQHLSPEITKTLDVNNIWMGEKEEDEYVNMAKLEVYYDESVEKWKTTGIFTKIGNQFIFDIPDAEIFFGTSVDSQVNLSISGQVDISVDDPDNTIGLDTNGIIQAGHFQTSGLMGIDVSFYVVTGVNFSAETVTRRLLRFKSGILYEANTV
jgi:hypothetical protein